jgi:hypothetical protein
MSTKQFPTNPWKMHLPKKPDWPIEGFPRQRPYEIADPRTLRSRVPKDWAPTEPGLIGWWRAVARLVD